LQHYPSCIGLHVEHEVHERCNIAAVTAIAILIFMQTHSTSLEFDRHFTFVVIQFPLKSDEPVASLKILKAKVKVRAGVPHAPLVAGEDLYLDSCGVDALEGELKREEVGEVCKWGGRVCVYGSETGWREATTPVPDTSPTL
jgi:hypothetical protein